MAEHQPVGENMITETIDERRIDAYCDVCKEGANAPLRGVGRAVIDAWKRQHEDCEARAEQERS